VQLLAGSPWLGGGDFAAAASVLAGYALLAQPANHVIRVLLDKETDRLVPEMVVGRGRGTRSLDMARRAGEATPPADAAPPAEASTAAGAGPVAAAAPAAEAAPSPDTARAAGTAPAPEAAPAPGTAPAPEAAPALEAAAAAEVAPAGTQADLDPDWQTLRAGRVIGALERWLIFTLVLHAQYSLVGLVLTAKSIA